jgi:ABC-type dipeptide/oligopeptide/nickel transport system ATPase subunit
MLEVEGANLHYGAAQALRGVSMKAEPAKITCVLGRNGVGKTSLMRAIVGHHPLSSGIVRFEGREFGRRAAYDRARSGIAFVPQGREIFPLLTVRENLETGFAPLKRDQKTIPTHVFELFPVLNDMLGRSSPDRSFWFSMSRPKASSLRSSRILAGRFAICAIARASRSSSSSSIWISAASLQTRFTSWIAARSCIKGRRRISIAKTSAGT